MTRRYRRSPHLVAYWRDGDLWLFNYALGIEARATELILAFLRSASDWTAVSHFRSLARGIPAPLVLKVLDGLAEAGLLECSERTRDAREIAMDAWTAWNPAAGFFHTVSRAVVYGDPEAFDAHLALKSETRPMPSSVRVPPRRVEQLPIVATGGEFTRVLGARRTWRQFGKGPVRRSVLARLLAESVGVRAWLDLPHLGEVPLTASPSGGSRHPIDVYVLALNVTGLPRGIYRYATDRHELDWVAGASRRDVREFFPGQPWFADCAVVVFFSAVFERTQWRYEFARAYRTIWLEAGHVCQTMLLTATALGLAPFCTMALAEQHIERLLGLDGISEAVFYAAGIGRRPRGKRRAVMPAGTTRESIRPHSIRAARARRARQ